MNLLIIVLTIGLGFFTANRYIKNSKFLDVSVYVLWIFHIIVGLGYYWFSMNNTADALHYWDVASKSTSSEILEYLKMGDGTAFIYVFNYFTAGVLGLSYFAGTFIHIYIGFVGLLLFMYVVEKLIPFNSKLIGIKLYPLIFFLPNLHFWTSGVGKDSLAFFCIGLLAFSLLNLKRYWYFGLFALGLLYLIRSHVALLLIVAVGMGYVFSGKVNLIVKVVFGLAVSAAVLYILPQVMEITGLQDMSLEAFNSRSAIQAEWLSDDSGSAVDISSYPFPLKVLTFLYRPTFTDITSLPSLIAAFENLFLLILTALAIKVRLFSKLKNTPQIIVVLLIFLILGVLVFSMSLGNMGIMLRMRNMFLPGMLIYFMWAMSWQNENKYKKIQLVKKVMQLKNGKGSITNKAKQH